MIDMIKREYVEYAGNCPTCGERQYGYKPEEVDIECGICEGRKYLRKIHDTKYKALEKGIIQGITGYDDKGMPTMMQIINNDFIYDVEFKEIKIIGVWKK